MVDVFTIGATNLIFHTCLCTETVLYRATGIFYEQSSLLFKFIERIAISNQNDRKFVEQQRSRQPNADVLL